jgi:DnaK suppressor protein
MALTFTPPEKEAALVRRRKEQNFMTQPAAKLEDSNLQIYRTLLLNKKAELQIALETNSRRSVETGEKAGARPDQILQEASVSVLMNRVLHGQLRQVGEALNRLDTGEYGYCVTCGDAIEPKRLQSVFWTQYCLLCREKASSVHALEKLGVGGVAYARHSQGAPVRSCH